MTAWLERRLSELSAEIRAYPTPIARCDEHLPALLEERARLLAQIEKPTCSPEALWVNDGGFDAA
jgi:hypothetical protein